ncbi:prepilin peptidase, partial [Pseudoalteromonas sp. S1649]
FGLSDEVSSKHRIDLAPFNVLKHNSTVANCTAPIQAWQYIPVLSWRLLKRLCANC